MKTPWKKKPKARKKLQRYEKKTVNRSARRRGKQAAPRQYASADVVIAECQAVINAASIEGDAQPSAFDLDRLDAGWAAGLLAKAEAAIGSPAAEWAGRCYEVACAIVDAKLIPGGEAVYGAWNGPVAPGTRFSGRPIVRHGWILLPDGRVVDPTRWVFEGGRPAIYVGPSGPEYDEGNQSLIVALRRPFPEREDGGKVFKLTPAILPATAWAVVERLTDAINRSLEDDHDVSEFTLEQLVWLANAPYADLGGQAAAVYAALDKLDLGGFVPIDNRNRAKREKRT